MFFNNYDFYYYVNPIAKFALLLWCIIFSHKALCCVPTRPSSKPVTVRPGITLTTNPPGCCPPLVQTRTASEFPDGIMVFTYDSITCRSRVTVNCSETDPAFELNAAIVVNGNEFLDYGPSSITFQGVCNMTNTQWYMGNPPLQVNTIECRLTNPPSP